MTTLEKIVKKAQALKKSYPKKYAKWTDYVKEASKEYKKSPDPVVKKKTKIGAIKKNKMKKKPIVKRTAKKLSNLIRTEIKSKKYIMPHGYEVRRSKLGAVMSISDNAKQLLIDCIDLNGYDMKANTPIEKIRAVEKIFYTEYGYLINRIGKLKALEEWLRGLPSVITIPFYNVEIIEIAKKWGSLKMNATEKQEDKILINYWRYMANQLLQLFNKKKLSDKFQGGGLPLRLLNL